MPGNAMQRQKASLSLDIIVVGGSIAGLSVAYALQNAGHRVVLLEQRDGTTPSYGGLRCPPNMTRILHRWGLAPHLDELGIKCPEFCWLRADDGGLIGVMKIHKQFLADLCADFMFVQHGDLHAMLLEIALREGVDVRYSSRVTTIDVKVPSITLSNGETLQADIIVGADGPDSIIRSAVLGRPVKGSYTNLLNVNFILSVEQLKEDPELRHFAEAHEWIAWLGSGYLVRACLVNKKTQYSLTLTMLRAIDPLKASVMGEVWKWNKQYTLEDLDLDLSGFEPRLKKMFQMAIHITATSHMDRPPVESVVSECGPVVIAGEASHPFQPHAMHSAALAIEDAEVLGGLFSRIHHPSEISRLLAAYEELRVARGISTLDYETRKLAMLTVPKGPKQEARDEALRRATGYETWDHMDEKSFREMWGDEMELYEYDATEKVDDWFTKWGGFLSRSRGNSELVPPTPTVEVSVSKEE